MPADPQRLTPAASRTRLIVAPVGPGRNDFRAWLAPRRSYDVLLINHGDRPAADFQGADYVLDWQGLKLELIDRLLRDHHSLVRRYATAWLPDDDIAARPRDIERLFDEFETLRLDIAQPGITGFNVSHLETKRRFYSLRRYGNHVEVMCPIFRTDVLFDIQPLLRLSRSAWGVEWIWSANRPGRVAILDTIPVRHTRARLAGNLYAKLRGAGVDWLAEKNAILAAHGLDGIYRQERIVLRPPWHLIPAIDPLYNTALRTLVRFIRWTRPLRRPLGLTRRPSP